MGLVGFSNLFPEVGPRETRVAIVPEGCPAPPDRYAFVEMYCTDPNCDCRRVMLVVMSETTKKPLACISYGFDRDGSLESGPYLDPLNHQSSLAPALLALAESIIRKDKDYLERLERHYAMVKALEKRRDKARSHKRKRH